MIVEMSRVSLVVSHQEREAALTELANSNLFHVGSLDNYNDSIADLHRRLTHAELMLRYLPDEPCDSSDNKKVDLDQVQQQIEAAYTKRSDLQKLIQTYNNHIAAYAAWGNFSLEDLNFLAQQGHFIRLYKLDAKGYKKLQSEALVPTYLCHVAKGTHHVAAYSVEEDKFPAIDALELPLYSLDQMKASVAEAHKTIQSLDSELSRLNAHRHALTRYVAQLTETIDFERTLDALHSEGDLDVLQGYVPTHDIPTLKEYAKNHGWALLVQDGLTGDEEVDSNVPTKVKPSFLGKFTQPILEGLGFTAGYQEMDISGVMFFFFAVFFAMIIGDAGYGFFFLLLSLFATIKLKAAGKPVNMLLPYVSFMSLLTIVWGLLTDNWFGFALSAHVPALASIKSDFLSDGRNIQLFSFLLGITHLTVAHTWGFILKLKHNPKAAPAEIGQFMMLFGFFFLIVNILLGDATFIGGVPSWAPIMIIAGLVIVLLFGSQQPGINLFKGFVAGSKNSFSTILGSISNFSDTLSYIRLYAVGLAGFSIAASFNQLALSTPIWIAPIILLGAHTLNIILGVLGVLVHAIRLNSLEFSMHLGLTWAGQPYKPFNAKRALILKDKN